MAVRQRIGNFIKSTFFVGYVSLLAAPSFAAPSFAAPVAAPKSLTVMSVDFCADQFVLAFAPRDQIVAVSNEATGVNSFFASRATGLRQTPGSVEDILLRKPDLVVRTWRGNAASDALMLRLGIKSFQPPYAMTAEDNLKNLSLAAAALGQPEGAAAMIADYHARWQALKDAPQSPLRAVYLTPSGFTAGIGTYVDDVIRLAGFDTVSPEIDLNGWGALPLEKIVLNPPDLVIGSFFSEGAVHVSAWSGGRHSAFRNLIKDLPTIMVPSKHLSCSGAFFIDAAEYIRTEASKLGLFEQKEPSR